MRGTLKAAIVGAVAAVAVSSSANAAVTFFNFVVDANGASVPEFIYSPSTGFTNGPGTIGDNTPASPGLSGVVSGLPGEPSSPPGLPGTGGPPYQFLQDLTMTLSGFPAVGNAVVNANNIQQLLGPGSFVIQYDAGGTMATPITILTGTTTSATLTRNNSGEAGVLSAQVVYTGGDLASELAGAGLSNLGTFSFGLSGLNPPGAGTLVPVGTDFIRLAGFSADGEGQFDAIALPEPSTVLGAAAVLGLTGMSRRRRA